MAALNRRNPDLSDLVGLNWSCWVDRVNVLSSDAGSDVEDSSKYVRIGSETMTLRKEDMHIYGHCPAQDDFCLVVCSHCGQVVKPQAFEKHCERRHGPLTKMCGQSLSLAPQQRPHPDWSPSNLSSSRERQKGARCHEGGRLSSAVLPVHQHKPTKAQKEAVSSPLVEKFTPESHPLLHHSFSTPCHRDSPRHSGPLHPGSCSSSTPPSEKRSLQKATARQLSQSLSHFQGTKTYSQNYKNIDKKECILNQHCGVLDPEKKKLHSWGLICKTDNIHQQQKALGKTKTTHQLTLEQRTASAGRDIEKHPVKSKVKAQHLDDKITQGNKSKLNSNCHISSSRDISESFLEEDCDSTVEVEVQPPYPFNQSLPSSEESEDDEQEEARDLAASPQHPKPLGLCTFGCRTLGCNIFTFDRRLHHLRLALSAMMEHHISTQLRKRIPPVSSGFRSHNVTPQTGRTGARPSQSATSFGFESTSMGKLENRSSQHSSDISKPPSSTTSSSLGLGRQLSLIGRPSKEVELMQDASAAQKTTKLPHKGDRKPSRYIRDPPPREKVQRYPPSSRGVASGTFSHEKKPCPPVPLQPSERHLPGLEKCPPVPTGIHCSPRSRARPSGILQKGYDHGHLGQKRKGMKESPPISPSLSRTSKCKRLSSPSCSSLLTWKGENIEDMLFWGLETRSNS
ncbi:ataxin-7-like protein 2b isoform X2 [Mastacembelus armatus]|uniref:ataxin-7-like protein 2b isoform X2 n=1 Tax=Mastacembelus armatus TaxID=205130 RepID=UPI000E463AD3|nr:ataxin-7-like protein 2 isoform X2 [Mastacembelus armatus]